MLGPPQGDGPVVVRASFVLHDINSINDEGETFEFSGVLTLKWQDKRQAFDPSIAGVNEKIYQGNFQFNEIAPSWFPQEYLVNESGLYEKCAVLLRVEPDGSSTLHQTVSAAAKAEFNMRRFPFDHHRLEASFELIGLDENEAILQVDSQSDHSTNHAIRVPQWSIKGISTTTGTRMETYTRGRAATSIFVVSVDVQRQPFFIMRLVVFPLMVIVLLSFSVFWMDRSSVGDRINVSFIGILTGVAYQIVMSDILPHISYFTLINAFLNLSFLTMCATVVVNLVVGSFDKKGRHEFGDLIDRRCRWIFPLAYVGLCILVFSTTLLLF